MRTSFTIGSVEVDITVWRLVFFGVSQIVTLGFFRNGPIASLIDYFYRSGMVEETMANRKAAAAAS